MRRLYVTKAGYWYVFLTIALGVVALTTANNVFYLMECLLLGGMILSGVVSERAISSVEVLWIRKQATAGATVRDLIRIDNPTRYSFFCLEVGEWKGGRFEPLAFVVKIGSRSQVTLPVSRRYVARGVHSWDGIAVATAAPFGFARKVLIHPEPGERLVWPEKRPIRGGELRESQLLGGSAADAEVRPYAPEDDVRSIVWKLSAKGQDPVARKNRLETPQVLLSLSLDAVPGPGFEDEVRTVASSIYRSDSQPGADIRLRITGRNLRKTIVGKISSLNFLATVSPGERQA